MTNLGEKKDISTSSAIIACLSAKMFFGVTPFFAPDGCYDTRGSTLFWHKLYFVQGRAPKPETARIPHFFSLLLCFLGYT